MHPSPPPSRIRQRTPMPRARSARWAALIAIFLLTISPAYGEITLYQKDDIKLSFLFDGALGLFKTYGTNFGAGLETPGGKKRTNIGWYEGFAIPYVKGSIDTDGGQFYGSLGGIAAATRGTSDASGGTFHQPGDADIEYAYIGWKSSSLLPHEDLIDLSFGRQTFKVGDGFLIEDGNADAAIDGGLYLGGRFSFSQSAIARINGNPVRFDVFYLKADRDFGSPRLVGANGEWHDDVFGTIGLYGFKITDARAEFKLTDMIAVAARGRGRPLAILDRLGDSHPPSRGASSGGSSPKWANAELAFEYVLEKNSRTKHKMDAYAWYGEAGYHFDHVSTKPHLFYRYSRFSGDRHDDDGIDHGFNRLFTSGDNYGNWFYGEITGQYITGTNLRVHQIGLRAYPGHMDVSEIGLLFYDFRYDRRPKGAGDTTVTSRHLGNEINLYLRYQPKEWLTFSPVAGVLFPGKGGEQTIGIDIHDKNYYLLQLVAFISF